MPRKASSPVREPAERAAARAVFEACYVDTCSVFEATYVDTNLIVQAPEVPPAQQKDEESNDDS